MSSGKPTASSQRDRHANSRQKVGRAAAEKLIAKNRRASFDYELDDHHEAGIVLVGSEVKSLRDGKVEMVDAYASIQGGECMLHQLYIAPYAQATTFAPDPRRPRKLLMHAIEIERLADTLKEGGCTLIPLRLYFKGRHVKIEIAVARGKSKGDKRQAIAKKEADREARAAMGRAMNRKDR